ncbi:MAG: SGNH/GDSL hydrolase family protein [Armatimonadetes bacterium]|nr:SGNH/GDSL hydrolase family protein [Armatimonadota bacterium]
MRKLQTARKIYTGCALVLLNTLVAFLLINLLVAAAYGLRSAQKADRPPPARWFTPDGAPVDNGMRTKEQLDWFDLHADPSMDETRASEVLDDFFLMARQARPYHTWAQSSAAPYDGKQVHVDLGPLDFPVRRTANPPRRPEQTRAITIYVFGGSTTMGYWVADDQTWPSYLSLALNGSAGDACYEVVNFGGVGYTQSQEFALFSWLLRNGQVPELAIFMDGVNVFPHDVAENSDKLSEATALVQGDNPALERTIAWKFIDKEWIRPMPLARLARSFQAREKRGEDSPDPRRAPGGVSEAVALFRGNHRLLRAICREYGVRSWFCLQPNAFYNYPTELYRQKSLRPGFLERRQAQREFYEAMAGEPGIVHLEHLFEDYGISEQRKAVLDYCHYTPDFNRFLARTLARRITEKR